MLIEIHMLKNYAPTNLNRDDTGAPKTCMFGGTQRGRISSQCLKRSWRTSELLKSEIGAENIGIRTRKLPELIAEKMKEEGYNSEWINAVISEIAKIGKNDKSKEENKEDKNDDKKEEKKEVKKKEDSLQTKQIIFYSTEDIQAVMKHLRDKLKTCKGVEDVKKIKAKDLQDALKGSSKRAVTLDMALFGRMVTSDAFADVEASMQVAHAISVNRVFMESDYFTAVDDLINGSDHHGSAIISDTDYNSSCYYIYASLDTDKLRDNLKNNDNADEIMEIILPALIRTMVFTNPSGKQNSFAGNTLPSALLVECKDAHIAVSLANAFEKPVVPSANKGIIGQSVERLKEECVKMANGFGIPVQKRLWFVPNGDIHFEDENTVNCSSFTELLAELPTI